MARLLSAAALRETAHCSACGATNPVSDDGYTACCNKRECTGWGYSRNEGCCNATADRIEEGRQRAARRPAAATAAPAPAPVAKEAARPAGRATRASQGESAVGAPWELLYDKPRLGVQVVRHQDVYALVCVKHLTLHRLERLSDEGAVRKAGGWCPDCER